MTNAAKRTEAAGGRANDTPMEGPNPFKVVRVEKIDAPDGAQGREWCGYVLESGRSTITGQRRGSLEDVTAYATHFAEQLNARSLKRAESTWTTRSKRPA